ncbi:MAG TPA: VWA domain-containing protein [Bryobacteraceae bacterium]|jgi:VWFA-related protein
MGFARVGRYAGVLVAFLLFGQDTIRVTVSEVLVPVTVTDPKGRFVSNLDKEDFKIYDNGQEQTIDFFSRDRNQPVVIGFLMDLSNNSKIHWKDYQEATINLVDTLMPGGDKRYSGYLIGYRSEPDLMVDTTHDSEIIVDKLRGAKPGGGSALYDALYEACTNRKLVVGEPIEPRRVVVIIGDGHDNSSKKTFQEVLELAQRQLVTIYGVSTSSYGTGNDEDDDVLLKLAKATGGKVEYPLENVYRDIAGYLEVPTDYGNYAYDVGTGGYSAAKASSIFRAIANLSGEITTQYILRYVPDIPEDSKNIRDIEVKVMLPDVKVRARRAYYPFSVPEVKTLTPR